MGLFDRLFGKKQKDREETEYLESEEREEVESFESEIPVKRKPLKRGFGVGDKILNRWTVKEIKGGEGKSGSGIVYIAQEHDGYLYAIKTLQDRFFENENKINRFINEANKWADSGKHSNIVFANGFFRIPRDYGKPYLLLEYTTEGNLRKFIDIIDIPQILDFAIQFCDGMSYAFNKLGMVHRDIKPENVMIAKDERFRFGYAAKITDFGLAKVYEREITDMEEDKIPEGFSLKQSGIRGTLPYMSPEQFSKAEIDTRSDIYSSGCMLYEMLTTKVPFHATNIEEYKNKHLKEIPESPKTLNDKIPDELDALVMKCLQKKPEDRYQNFEEVISELIEIYRKESGEDYIRIGEEEKLIALERFNRGITYYRLGRFEEAEKEYRAATTSSFLPSLTPEFVNEHSSSSALMRKFNSVYAEAHDNLGVLLHDLNRFDEAEKEYREAIMINPDLAEAHSGLGVLLKKLNRYEAAEKEYREAIRINPDYAKAHHNLGELFYELHRFEEAEKEYREAIRINPDYAEAHHNLGGLFYDLKRYNEAEKECRKAIRINPNYSDAHYNLGMLLYKSHRYKEAEKEFKEVIKINPEHAEVHNNLGGLFHNLKRYGEAEKEFREAIRINPNHVGAHSNLGAVFYGLKRFREAEGEYREAIRINPGFAEVHYNLGNLLRDLKRFEEAEKEFREVIMINPNHVDAHNELGILLVDSKRFEEAEKEFRKAIKIDPDNAIGHTSLGTLFQILNRFEEAEKELREAVSIDPNNADAHTNLGAVFYSLKRFGEAEKELREAVRINPIYVNARLNLGLILWQTGRKIEAEEHFNTLLRLRPDLRSRVENIKRSL